MKKRMRIKPLPPPPLPKDIINDEYGCDVVVDDDEAAVGSGVDVGKVGISVTTTGGRVSIVVVGDGDVVGLVVGKFSGRIALRSNCE